jgi:hypothetical protein
MQDTFKRGQDPKISMGLGIKEGDGYILNNLNPKSLLPGFLPDNIYIINHTSSHNSIGVCSGKKATKVIRDYMKKHSYKERWREKWIWTPSIAYYGGDPKPHPEGGYLKHKYASKDAEDNFWVDSLSADIAFLSRQGIIIEL